MTAIVSVFFVRAANGTSSLAEGFVWRLKISFRVTFRLLFSACRTSAGTLRKFKRTSSEGGFKQNERYSVLSISSFWVFPIELNVFKDCSDTNASTGVGDDLLDFCWLLLFLWPDEFDLFRSSGFVHKCSAALFSTLKDLAYCSSNSKHFGFVVRAVSAYLTLRCFFASGRWSRWLIFYECRLSSNVKQRKRQYPKKTADLLPLPVLAQTNFHRSQRICRQSRTC